MRALLATALALLAGCGVVARAPQAGLRPGVQTELFFGRVGPDGAIVDDAAWQDFLTTVVTPRFPDGFTVIDAAGQYRGGADATITRERSEILVIVHAGDARTEASLDEIVAAYKKRFGQHAVLRVDGTATIGF